MDKLMTSSLAVHPENRIEAASLPPKPGETGTFPFRMVAGGAICGLLGAILGTMLVSAEIAAGDTFALLMMIPLSAAVVAVVTGWTAAMILVGTEKGNRE